VAKFEIYKRGQGKYTRITTFVSVMVLGLAGAYVLSLQLVHKSAYVRFGVPTVLVVGLALLMYWLVNRPRTADFLIATEGEMKKVSWSSRREVIGSTKVVIITTFIVAGILYAVDAVFVALFNFL
jgi:preprotein translocase subunit SecE